MTNSMELQKPINNQLLKPTKSSYFPNDISFKLTDSDVNFDDHSRLKSMYKYISPQPNSGSNSLNKVLPRTNGNINGTVNGHATANALVNGNGQLKSDGIPVAKHLICSPERIQLEWKQSTRIGAGYMNLGNTCFMNSVLQCLTHCPPLVNYLLYSKEDHLKNCKVISFCMTCELVNHMRKAIEHSGNVIRPSNIFQRLKSIAKHFQHGRQEDSHEFLRYVIDNIWKSCIINWESNHSIKLDAQSKETTFINQIFGGYHRSQITCLCCNAKSNTYDYFMDFILDIKSLETLEKALDKFIKPEVLQNENAYKCTKCNKKVSAKKCFTVHRAPNVATFQLKRFDYNRIFGGKITKYVSYPEVFNLRPYMSEPKGAPIYYRLNAVLVHLGGTSNSGHYFCYVRGSNNSWYLMDDSKVSQVSLNHVLHQQAYILFYVRQPSKMVASQNTSCSVSTDSNRSSSTATPSPAQNKGLNGQSNQIRQLNAPPYVNNGFNGKPQTPIVTSSATGIQRSTLNKPKMISDESLVIKRSPATNGSVSAPTKSVSVGQLNATANNKGMTNGFTNGNSVSSTLVPYGDDTSDEELNPVDSKVNGKSDNGALATSSTTNGHASSSSSSEDNAVHDTEEKSGTSEVSAPMSKSNASSETNGEKEPESSNKSLVEGVSRLLGDKLVVKNEKQKKHFINQFADFASTLGSFFDIDTESALKEMEANSEDTFKSICSSEPASKDNGESKKIKCIVKLSNVESKSECTNGHVSSTDDIKQNGLKADYSRLNGIKQNGIKENGIKQNGCKQNGIKPKQNGSDNPIKKLVSSSQNGCNLKIKSTSSFWTVLDPDQVKSPSITSGSSSMSGSTTEWRVIDKNESGTLKKHFKQVVTTNGRATELKCKQSSSSTYSSSGSSYSGSAKSSMERSLDNGHTSDHASGSKKKRRYESEDEREEEEEQRKHKKSKKHKKDKRKEKKKSESLDQYEPEVEWIEKTKETLFKDSTKSSNFKARKVDLNTVNELKNMHISMYGQQVSTWEGSRTELDKLVVSELNKSAKKSKTDIYNEEYDRGKESKKKKPFRSDMSANKNRTNVFEKMYKKKYL